MIPIKFVYFDNYTLLSTVYWLCQSELSQNVYIIAAVVGYTNIR